MNDKILPSLPIFPRNHQEVQFALLHPHAQLTAYAVPAYDNWDGGIQDMQMCAYSFQLGAWSEWEPV